MSSNLNKKLDKLEKHLVVDDVDETTCLLDLQGCPEAEKVLHETARNLLQSFYKQPIDKLSQEQKEIVERSGRLITTRVFLLFRSVIKTLYGIENGVYSVNFDLRLLWFLQEAAKLGLQTIDLRKLEESNAGLDEDSLEKKRIDLENTFAKLWTNKSFDDYEINALRGFLRNQELDEQNKEAISS